MKKILLSLIVLGATVPAFTQNISAKLDTLIGAYKNELGFNGAVLVATKGTVILEKGYGYKNQNGQNVPGRRL